MKSKNNIIQVKDHLVSGENFKVVYNEPLGYASTQIQKQTDLSNYYPKTDYASHKEKPKGLKGKAYVMVQQFMLRYKHSIIKQHLSGINLLDFGGGIGVFANYMSKMGYPTTLIEPNTKARKIAVDKRIESYHSLDDLPNVKKYDLISFWHTLEHVDNIVETIQNSYKILKNNGIIIIAVPNLNSFDSRYYGVFWAALDVPRHLWHFTPKGLNQLLDRNGFSLLKTYPLWFDAIYISLISERYSGNRFAFFKGLFLGLYSNFRAFFNGEYSSKIFIYKKS